VEDRNSSRDGELPRLAPERCDGQAVAEANIAVGNSTGPATCKPFSHFAPAGWSPRTCGIESSRERAAAHAG